MQQAFAQLLVLRDRLGDGTCGVDFGGLYPPLLAAPAKANHAAIGHAAVWNIARQGGIHHRSGTWAQAHVFVEFAHLVQHTGQVKRRIVQGGLAECVC